MSAEGDVPVPDKVVESSKTTKISRHTNPLTGDSLLQMTPLLPTLPFDMITEILLRLPLKFLMQLKRVCKPWNSLISDRKFARKHLHMSTMNPNILLDFKEYSPEFFCMLYPLHSIFTNVTTDGTQIKFPLDGENFGYRIGDIVGSYDGILCLTTRGSRGHFTEAVVLWNPSIKKYKLLPSLECSYTPSYGFGHDHFTDNYKVVAVFRYNCDSSTVYKVKVHTLGTNSWRFIDDFPYGTSTVFPVRSSGEFVSGTLNWLVYLADSVTVRPIVSLDLGTESYQEILQPDYGEEGVKMISYSTLGVLSDCLCILRGRDIWLMKEYGNRDSWTKFATVPHLGLYCNVIHISEDDQVLMLFRETFVVYDSINGTSKSLNIKDNSFWVPKIYVESLISPCS